MCLEPVHLWLIGCVLVPIIYGAYSIGNVRGFREGMERAHRLHQEVLRDYLRKNNLHSSD